MYQAPTAPQTIGGVLDTGFRLYRACLASTFLFSVVAAFVAAPLNRMARSVDVTAPAEGALGSLLLGLLVAVVVSLVFYGGIIARIAALADGRVLSAADALGAGLRRGPALLGAYICYLLAVFVGVLLFIVPGVIVAVSLLFGRFGVVTESRGPVEGLLHSRNLVRGHWWRTTGVLTVSGIILISLTMLLSLLSTIPILMNPDIVLDPGVFPWYVDYLVSPLLSGLFTPLWCALLLAVLFDLKIRHEGGDLAARIAAADA
jgi:hypothetical protein